MSETNRIHAVTHPPPDVPERRRKRRLVGIDVARGIAVIGMFTAHFNPFMLEPDHWLQRLVSGRSAALFALLAGVSVALLSGGNTPRSGAAMRATRAHLATRAVLLFALGLALSELGTTVKEILTVYGVLFLLAIPLLRLRPAVLAGSAALLGVAGPLASFALRSTVITDYRIGITPSFDNFTSAHGLLEAARGLLLTGPYPVLTWLPFLLAGMAIGRLDLHATATRVRLAASGAVLAAASYAASLLLMGPLGGYRRIIAHLPDVTTPEQVDLAARSTAGLVPTTDPGFLLTTAGHSGAPLEIWATSGLAMLIIGVALIVADRVGVLLLPLSSIGALALTSYAGHIVVIYLLGLDGMIQLLTLYLYLPLLVLIGVTMLVTTVWRQLLGRGPLEWVLHKAGTAVGDLARS